MTYMYIVESQTCITSNSDNSWCKNRQILSTNSNQWRMQKKERGGGGGGGGRQNFEHEARVVKPAQSAKF